MELNTSYDDFQPKPSASLSVQLHQHLRNAIIRGELKPGQALSEVELSKQFSLSRQPVREAFIRLADERLIEILPQRGSFVRRISIKEVIEARFLREAIEVALVRRVAESPEHEAIAAELRRIIVAQRKVKPDDSRAFLALDDEFHQTIAMHAGGEYTLRISEAIKSQLNRARRLSFESTTSMHTMIGEHDEIVEAIAAGDADRAVREVEAHMRTILNDLPLISEKFPEHFLP